MGDAWAGQQLPASSSPALPPDSGGSRGMGEGWLPPGPKPAHGGSAPLQRGARGWGGTGGAGGHGKGEPRDAVAEVGKAPAPRPIQSDPGGSLALAPQSRSLPPHLLWLLQPSPPFARRLRY